jgi:[acyl-carrier-protein] S-malonyltransferase
MSLALFFPGQGSQSLGMLQTLADVYPVIAQTFADASAAINVDLWALSQQGPEADLNRTENTQPALLAAGVAVFRAWKHAGGAQPIVLAGHSLGEYSALVCAGAMELADATRLVQLRGRLMQASVPEGLGAMAAVLNGELDVIEAACADAAQNEVIAPANLNAPGQIVISGHATALDRALAILAEKGVRKAIKLPVSVPSHCELMRPASVELARALDGTRISKPTIPVLHNVSAAPTSDPTLIREMLVRQLYDRVRWIDCVRAARALGATRALECGPGKALTGMVKRIEPEMQAQSLATATDFAAALSA